MLMSDLSTINVSLFNLLLIYFVVYGLVKGNCFRSYAHVMGTNQMIRSDGMNLMLLQLVSFAQISFDLNVFNLGTVK